MEHKFKEELKTSFDFDKIFDFCENNTVILNYYLDDSKYHCYINRKEWDTPKGVHENPFAALVLGINSYTENNNQ